MPKILNVSSLIPVSEQSSGYSELQVLIKDCIAQSRSAQKKLYDRYAPDSYTLIRRYIINNDQVSREILNDAFFKVFRDLGQYSFNGSFEGWVRRITINTVNDHFRRNVKPERNFKEVQDDDAYINSGPVENLTHKELLKVIETLPDTQREIFNLFVFENFSHKEIAKLLNIKQNNCRWHLNDARRRLKEKLSFFNK